MTTQQIFNVTLNTTIPSQADGIVNGSVHYGTLPSGQEILYYVSFASKETIGVSTLVAISCISLLAILVFVIAVLVSAFKTQSPLNQHMFVRTNLAPYFLSLLACDFLQAIGSILSARWVAEKGILMGGFCSAQGTVKQAADIGAAFWTMVITFNTFWILFFEWKVHRYVMWGSMISGWSAICTIIILGPATLDTDTRGPYYNIAGYWCWISPQYSSERITLAYLPMLSASAFSFFLFVLIFLRLRGYLVVTGWRVKFVPGAEPTAAWRNQDQGEGQMIVIAKQMLLFPIAYTVLILPIACLRFTEFAGHNVAFESIIFCAAILMLSGLVHVVLFVASRRILSDDEIVVGPLTRPRLAQSESFFYGPDSFTNTNSGSVSKPPMLQRTPSFDIDMEKELSAMESYEVVGVVTAPQVAKNRHTRDNSRRHSHLGSISIANPFAKHNSRRISYQVGTSESDRYTVPDWIQKVPAAGVPSDIRHRDTMDSVYSMYEEPERTSMEEIKLSGPRGQPQEVFVVLSPRLNEEEEQGTHQGFRF